MHYNTLGLRFSLQEGETNSNESANGNHDIASSVNILDTQEFAGIPEQVTNTVACVKGEWEGKSEFQGGQAQCSELHGFKCSDNRVSTIGTGESGKSENCCISNESTSSSTVSN